jgi:hypothetical protein
MFASCGAGYCQWAKGVEGGLHVFTRTIAPLAQTIAGGAQLRACAKLIPTDGVLRKRSPRQVRWARATDGNLT